MLNFTYFLLRTEFWLHLHSVIKQLISIYLLLQPLVTRRTGSYILTLIITWLYKQGNHYQRAKINMIFWDQFQLWLSTSFFFFIKKKATGKALAVFRNQYRKFHVMGLILKLRFSERSQKNIRSWTFKQKLKIFVSLKVYFFYKNKAFP